MAVPKDPPPESRFGVYDADVVFLETDETIRRDVGETPVPADDTTEDDEE